MQEEVKVLGYNEEEDSLVKPSNLASLIKKELKSSIGSKETSKT